MTAVDVCRFCEHATKNPDRLDRPTKGLTSLSICKQDDALVLNHVRDRYCPLGKFRAGPGDVLARVFHKIRLHHVRNWWERVTGIKCDCKGRQLALNHWWEKLIRRWFGKRAQTEQALNKAA